MVMLTDTSIWVDHLRGRETSHVEVLREQLTYMPTPIGDLVAMELLQGALARDLPGLELRLGLLTLHAMARPAVVLRSAMNYQYLRQRGYTVRSSIDCIIATYCIQEGHSLLHNDRDFEPFENLLGLKVIHV